MKLVKINEIFEVIYPKTLVLSHLEESENGINFVSSSGKNNGVSTTVNLKKGVKIYPAGSITVALKGSVLSTFVQNKVFYCAHQIAVLINKEELSEVEKLIYCNYIKANKYRFNFGRQADKTFKSIKIPHLNEVKNIASKFQLPKEPTKESKNSLRLNLSDRNWDWFFYEDVFNIYKGKRLTKFDMEDGSTPFVGAIDSNNGVSEYINYKPIFDGNTITVSYNGSVAEAFYQPSHYWASDDINILSDDSNFNPFIGMFLITLIKQEKYRFNYGRKWHKARMEKSKIKLPVDSKGDPDWQFMEDYIKSLPYSSNL